VLTGKIEKHSQALITKGLAAIETDAGVARVAGFFGFRLTLHGFKNC
jgi:hypothetical protein